MNPKYPINPCIYDSDQVVFDTLVPTFKGLREDITIPSIWGR